MAEGVKIGCVLWLAASTLCDRRLRAPVRPGALHFGRLLACLFSFWMASGDAVANSIKVFGVDVYVVGPAPSNCRELMPPLRAQVGSFQPEASLEEIVAELARLTLERGGNTLHSVRVLNPSERGFSMQVAGVAARCDGTPPTGEASRFDSKLVAIVRAASSARAFSFPDSGRFGPERSVKSARLFQRAELLSAQINGLRELLLSENSYELAGLAVSCPFEPAFGFQFVAAAAEAWWLVSTVCTTATLVSAEANWMRSGPIAPVRKGAMQQVMATARELGLVEVKR
jgi:hypothetical protein